jgi:hypothetical protein
MLKQMQAQSGLDLSDPLSVENFPSVFALLAENPRMDPLLLRSDKLKLSALDNTAGQAPPPLGRAYPPAPEVLLRSKSPNLPKEGFAKQQINKQPAFELGRIIATPGALAAIRNFLLAIAFWGAGARWPYQKKETEVALVLTKLRSDMHRNQTFRAPLASTLATLLKQPTAEGHPSPEAFFCHRLRFRLN